MKKTGILLVNLGTPDEPEVPAVRRYLSQFLNDPRVIDLPFFQRKALVNLIIVPFRSPKSTKVYKELWTENGSPLMYYGKLIKEKLQKRYNQDEVVVELAMRYQNPSMESVLEKMRLANYDKIIVLPLFPQYASSTGGSVLQRAMEIISQWYVIPELSFVSQFYDHPKFIDAFVENGKAYNLDDYDHVLFSYHGVPERQVDKVYEDGIPCSDHDCETKITDENKFCYKAACYATTRMMVEKLGIPEDKYTVAFQSRLGKDPWIKPYSDKVIVDLANKGVKKILAFSPAFIADCLETTIEIGEEYQEIFEEHGGEKIDLVPSLNDNDGWVDALHAILAERL
jgi:protoporphyrin/coproporphyrin ferrochelatase